jgi:hypothetical protein
MGGADAPRTPEEGADSIVWLATSAKGGPHGTFIKDRKTVAW